AASANVQVDFLDVPPGNEFHDYIDTIARNRITVGCHSGTEFCPADPTTRQEMAVFLLKSSEGFDYVPPQCTPPGIFSDVPCTPGVGFPDWIEDLYNRGITAGCSTDPGPPPTIQYCPTRSVLRSEMAAFLLKTSQGSSYVPPQCTPPGLFSDVPCNPGVGFSDWIEDLYNRQITGGCLDDPLRYCPDDPNTRGQMAVFLVKTFGLM
ncbi:MAG: hypothetical protein ABLT11_06020, partial [Candidatus Acidiferrum sp.]